MGDSTPPESAQPAADSTAQSEAAPDQAQAAPTDPPAAPPAPIVAAPEPGADASQPAAESTQAAATPPVFDGTADDTTAPNATDAADPAAAETTPGTLTAASGEDGPRKRKRKRKRKKQPGADGAEAADGEAGATQPAEGGAPREPKPRPKKRETITPLSRFLPKGSAAKRHAFSVGEVVAGRVQRVEGTAVVIDLFGKATATADLAEPRDVPIPAAPEPLPEPAPRDPQPAPTQVAAAGDAAPAEGVAAATAATEDTAPIEGAGAAEQAEPVEGASVAAADGPAAQAATPEAAAGEEGPSAEDLAVAEQLAAAEEAVAADAAEAVAAEAAEEAAAGEAASEEVAADAPESQKSLPPAPAEPYPVVPADLASAEQAELGAIMKGRIGAISESGHIMILNRLVNRAEVRAELEICRAQRRRVEGLVFGFNRGGFDVLVGGLRGFCPASAMSLEEIADPVEYIGRKYEFQLPAQKSSGKDVVVSRRSILEREQRKKAKELLKGLKAGQTFKGRVTSVRDFGLFVDIGGVEGLVHQSELSFAHAVRPEDVAKAGDEIDVQVLRVGGDKKEGGRKERLTRVSLSVRALLPDPWDTHGEALAEGTVQKGKITRTTDFGAFIELVPEVEGLLHITELGKDLKHADQAVKEGDEIHVVIERVDKTARRISLSKLTPAEVAEHEAGTLIAEGPRPSLKPGKTLVVKVDKVEQYGVIVRVSGVIGRRARGFIPSRELGGEPGDMRKRYPQGKELEVKILGVDRDGGLKCSVKALAIDEERKAVKDYRREASKQGFGTFGDLLKAKLEGPAPK